jgi:hypothetical protein
MYDYVRPCKTMYELCKIGVLSDIHPAFFFATPANPSGLRALDDLNHIAFRELAELDVTRSSMDWLPLTCQPG